MVLFFRGQAGLYTKILKKVTVVFVMKRLKVIIM